MRSSTKKFSTGLMVTLFSVGIGQASSAGEVKNVILMIGDGMGPQQIGLLELYARKAPNSIYEDRQTAISRFMENSVNGMSLTHPNGSMVVDSASSATQLAIGAKAPSEIIGLNTNGDPQETILEKAR